MPLSSSTSGRQRLTLRQRDSDERRERMTRRRNETTHQIRKTKKLTYLACKRGLIKSQPSTEPHHDGLAIRRQSAVIALNFKQQLRSWFQNMTVQELQQILGILNQYIENPSIGSSTLHNPLVVLDREDEEVALKFMISLNHEATAALQRILDDTSIEVLMLMFQILVQLTSIQTKTSSDQEKIVENNYYGAMPVTWSEVVVSSGWLQVFSKAITFRPEFAEYICLILGNVFSENGSQRCLPLESRPVWVSALISAVPVSPVAAAWALTNMIRSDHTSLGSTYCADDLLSPELLIQWLQQPAIATQTAWMIASVTARECQTVMYLCQRPSFLSFLVNTLASPVVADQAEPILEALGNIASHEVMISPLLTKVDNPPLIPLLQHILANSPASSNNTGRHNVVLIISAWLAGCLLVDAGIQNHPSTTIAAPALIPTLMERLGNGMMSLEEEREFVLALWNALSCPPDTFSNPDQQHNSDELVFGVHNLPKRRQPPANLPFHFDLPRSMLQVLVRLVASKDADAVVASVHVLDLMLRRYDDNLYAQQSLVTIMQEEDVAVALENVCNSPLEEAAEVAADLLDDYFLITEENGHELSTENNYPWMSVAALPTEENAFVSSSIGGGDFVSNTSVSTFDHAVAGMGRGRGRGTTLPAWMSK